VHCAQQIVEDNIILRTEVLLTGEAGVNLPVNLKRLIWNSQQLFKIKPHKKVPSGAIFSLHKFYFGSVCARATP